MEVSTSQRRTIGRGRGRPAQALYMPPARRHRSALVNKCENIKIATNQKKEIHDKQIMDVKTPQQQSIIDPLTPIIQLKDLSISNHINTEIHKSAEIIDITKEQHINKIDSDNTKPQSNTMSLHNHEDASTIANKLESETSSIQSVQLDANKFNALKISSEQHSSNKETSKKNPEPQVISISQVQSRKSLDTLETEKRNDNDKEAKGKTKNVKVLDVKCDVLQISVAKNIKKSPIKLVQVDQWEDLFNNEDENAACEKRTQSHDSTNISNCYDSDDNENENLSNAQMEHILEIYDFPASFKAPDIMQIYHELDHNSVYIKWINETKALLVLGSAIQAKRALTIEHPFIKSRPVAIGSQAALDVVKNSNLRPAMKRPPTSMHAARRMITTALGAKTQVSREVQQRERDALRKAKEERRTQRQNERDAWEGNPRPTTA